MTIDLDGRVALVGGASQGIGEATAHVLAECGARVILLSRRAPALEAVRERLPHPERHVCIPIDLERLDDVTAFSSRLKEMEPISIWVNNSGGPKAGPLHEARPEHVELAVRGHVLASQILLQGILPGMKAAGFGRIINVLSTSVKVPLPNLGVSNLVRAAMASWAKTLSVELGPLGITVNNVLPGYTRTPRLESLARDQAQRSGRQPHEVEQDWQSSVPLKRLAEPKEVAQAIAFLASPLASYVSGVQLPVDGGRTGAL